MHDVSMYYFCELDVCNWEAYWFLELPIPRGPCSIKLTHFSTFHILFSIILIRAIRIRVSFGIGAGICH